MIRALIGPTLRIPGSVRFVRARELLFLGFRRERTYQTVYLSQLKVLEVSSN